MAQPAINPDDLSSESNVFQFILERFLSQNAFITLAVVKKTYRHTVDVMPLVSGTTALGERREGEIIYDLPVWRLQRGSSAIIMNPVEGDIGAILVCDQDISNVKKTKNLSMPGSTRKHNYADALYLGGILNKQPSSYIEFADNQINIKSAGDLNVDASKITVNGNMQYNGVMSVRGEIILNGIPLSEHRHPFNEAASITDRPI